MALKHAPAPDQPTNTPQIPEQWTTHLEDFAAFLEYERGASRYTLRNYMGDVGLFLQFIAEDGASNSCQAPPATTPNDGSMT